MSKIIISGISYSATPTAPQTVTIKYRPNSAPDVPGSYIVVDAAKTVAVNGTMTPAVEITGLTANTAYTIAVSNNCNGVITYKSITTDEAAVIAWIENVYVCESDDYITTVFTATGFSSPSTLHFNSTNNRVYVVDADDALGNFYSFNPNTFAGIGDITRYAGVADKIYYSAIDVARNRIYSSGLNTGGLVVFDMSTNTFLTTVPYGSNVAFGRLFIGVSGDTIYTSFRNGGTNTVTLINANTLTVTTTLNTSAIPTGTGNFEGGYIMNFVDGNAWVTPGAGRALGGIAVYNATLTSLITTIALPGAAVVPGWGGSKYWSNSYYDEPKDRFYLHDFGSNKLYVINTTTNTIVKTINFTNREGKLYTSVHFSVDPVSGQMFMNYNAFDSNTDAAGTILKRVYLFDRDTLEMEILVPDISIGVPIFQTGTPFLWGNFAGRVQWEATPGWDTDGTITKLTY